MKKKIIRVNDKERNKICNGLSKAGNKCPYKAKWKIKKRIHYNYRCNVHIMDFIT